jgi:hypothetical protein
MQSRLERDGDETNTFIYCPVPGTLLMQGCGRERMNPFLSSNGTWK